MADWRSRVPTSRPSSGLLVVSQGRMHGGQRIPGAGKAGVDGDLAQHFAYLLLRGTLTPRRSHVNAELQLLVERGKHCDGAERPRLGIQRLARVDLAVDELNDVPVKLWVELLQVIPAALDVRRTDEGGHRVEPAVGVGRHSRPRSLM